MALLVQSAISIFNVQNLNWILSVDAFGADCASICQRSFATCPQGCGIHTTSRYVNTVSPRSNGMICKRLQELFILNLKHCIQNKRWFCRFAHCNLTKEQHAWQLVKYWNISSIGIFSMHEMPNTCKFSFHWDMNRRTLNCFIYGAIHTSHFLVTELPQPGQCVTDIAHSASPRKKQAWVTLPSLHRTKFWILLISS